MPAGALLALAFTGGATAAAILGGPWWGSAGVAALLATGWRASAPRDRRASMLVLAAAVVLAGAGHARFEASLDGTPPAVEGLAGAHVLDGVVRADADRRGSVASFDLDVRVVDGAAVADGGGGVRVSMRVSTGAEAPRAGDRVRLEGELEAPPELEAFDYAGYLRSRDVQRVVGFPTSLEVLAPDTGSAPVRALRALRRGAVSNIERTLPEPAAALAAGMLLGERRTLPAELRDALRVTGTSHLVVVSGQNVALLLGVTIAALTVVVSRRWAAIASLVLLPGYVLLVGADPPVVRAALMAVGIAAASALGRRTPAWVFLAYALASMLAWSPSMARDVAFQLSASATAGVILLAPPLRDLLLSRTGARHGSVAGAVLETGATALGAGLAVLPVQVAVFGTLAPLTLPANVLVAPLYAGTVAVALAASLVGGVEPAAAVVGGLGRYVPEAFGVVVRALAALPGAEVGWRAPSIAVAAGAAGLVVLGWALWRWTPRITEGASGEGGLAAPVAASVVAAGVWIAVLAPGGGLASVTVLDVGQGLAVLVEDGGQRVLIDVGPADGSVVAALGGTRALAAVVVTHADADHAGGLDEVLRRLEVGRVLASVDVASVGLGVGAAERLERLDIGDRLVLSERTWIEVLGPPRWTGAREASENDRSLVLMVHLGERRVLLPADIEAAAEGWLVASGWPLRADALVAPHHGSKSSSTAAFLERVAPSVVVASVGLDNPYGHPAPEVVARTKAAGAAVWRTDEASSVTLRSDGTRLWIEGAR